MFIYFREGDASLSLASTIHLSLVILGRLAGYRGL